MFIKINKKDKMPICMQINMPTRRNMTKVEQFCV